LEGDLTNKRQKIRIKLLIFVKLVIFAIDLAINNTVEHSFGSGDCIFGSGEDRLDIFGFPDRDQDFFGFKIF
jgi:hypothetical protein